MSLPRLKIYGCSRCSEQTEPTDIDSWVPQCWARIQWKSDSSGYWHTSYLVCPSCTRDLFAAIKEFTGSDAESMFEWWGKIGRFTLRPGETVKVIEVAK